MYNLTEIMMHGFGEAYKTPDLSLKPAGALLLRLSILGIVVDSHSVLGGGGIVVDRGGIAGRGGVVFGLSAGKLRGGWGNLTSGSEHGC